MEIISEYKTRMHEWYPPVKYVFYPLYKFFRKKVGLNMYISNMTTWGTSAILHAAMFIPSERYITASIFGGFFLTLGGLSTTSKYLARKSRKNKKRSLERILKE